YGIDYSISGHLLFVNNQRSNLVSPLPSNHTNSLNITLQKVLNKQKYHFLSRIAFDWIHELLYWTDDTSIEVISIHRPSLRYVCVENSFDVIRNVAIDPLESLIIWIQWQESGDNDKIMRSSQAGTDVKVVVDYDLKYSYAFTLDVNSKTIYWIDSQLYTLSSIGYFGQNRRTIAKSYDLFSSSYRMDFFADYIYWTNDRHNAILRTHRTGSNGTKRFVVFKANVSIDAIKIVDKTKQPMIALNRCLNANCTHLCLPSGVQSFMCLCPSIKYYDYSAQEKCRSDDISKIMDEQQKPDVKHIADIVGEWGKWQFQLITFCFILWGVAAVNNMGYSFMAYDNDFWCSDVPPDYQFNLVCDRKHFASFTQTAYMLGYAVSGLIFAHYSDKYGRRPTCCGPKYRADISILGGIGWVLGYAAVPGLALWLQDYRYLLFVSLLGLGSMMVWYYFMFESPRWQITNGQTDRAEQTLRKALKINGKSDENLKQQLTELSAYLQEMQSHEKSVKNHTILDLVKTPALRKITFILWYTWIVNALLYYGLSFNMSDFGGNFYITFLLSGIVELPSQLLSALMLRYIGRCKLFGFFMLLTGVSCFAIIPVERDWIKVTFALIGKFGVSSSWNVMAMHGPELYPTVLRQRGLGAASVVGRIGSITAPFMKNLAATNGLALVMGLYGVLMLSGTVLVQFLPETKGREIPDTIEEAERAAYPTKVKHIKNKTNF
ncbi:unnamed protein product, partial [Medioppia subpectinata]